MVQLELVCRSLSCKVVSPKAGQAAPKLEQLGVVFVLDPQNGFGCPFLMQETHIRGATNLLQMNVSAKDQLPQKVTSV